MQFCQFFNTKQLVIFRYNGQNGKVNLSWIWPAAVPHRKIRNSRISEFLERCEITVE